VNIKFLESGLTAGHPRFGRNAQRVSTDPPILNPERDPALDFLKGFLVLGMIAYHAGVSFIPDTHIRSLLLNGLLDFVSGSWALVCGLIITTHYRARFQVEAHDVSKRLWVRAAKLILLFSVLNLLVIMLGVRQASQLFDLTTLAKVFVYGDGRLTSFGILLGIGYVILLGPWFLSFRTAGVAASMIAIVSEEVVVRMGYAVPGNLWIVFCGLAGMTIGATIWPGFMRAVRVNSLQRWMTTGIVLSAATAYYVVSIGWNLNRSDMPIYLWGVASIVAALYLSYGWFSSMPTVRTWLQLLGRYSLISYLLQMALIRLAFSAQSSLAVVLSYGWIFLIVVLVVGLAIAFLDKEIRKSMILEKSYRLVFG
jgi:hypothetical protein